MSEPLLRYEPWPPRRPAGALARLDLPRSEPEPALARLPDIRSDLERYVGGQLDALRADVQAAIGAAMDVLRGELAESLVRWPEWMTPQQAAEYVGGVSCETLRRWVTAEMPSIRRRSGNTWYYRKADLDRLMEQRFPRDDEGA